MIFSEPLFTDEEIKSLTKDQIRLILKFLEIPFESKDTKGLLTAKLQDYQVSIQHSADISSEPPRYSVRVRAIMERKEREKNGT